MERKLFLCNTVYQVFVAMWMKRRLFPDAKVDILISDHMNNGEGICKKLRQFGEFENCYYVQTFRYARRMVTMTNEEYRQTRLFPNSYLQRFVKLPRRYGSVYMANVDQFSQLLYNALKCKLYLFEDGMATYSKLMQRYYESTKLPEWDRLHTMIRCVFREKGIHGNVEGMYLFHPENMMWEAPFPLLGIERIDCEDAGFAQICNRVFDYDETADRYDQKYIFMEESFAAEGTPINDVEILEQLARRVGKENIMVKIHPRNPVNRFAEKGFATNQNTAIPWEVILMNLGDVSDKVFITVGSSSVLNPILLFGANIRAYSLYDLVDKQACRSALLSGTFWEAVYSVIQKYPHMVKLCSSVDEIV